MYEVYINYRLYWLVEHSKVASGSDVFLLFVKNETGCFVTSDEKLLPFT